MFQKQYFEYTKMEGAQAVARGAQPPGSPVATKLSARQPEYFSKQYAECEVKTKKKVFTSRIHKFSRVLSAKFYYCFQQISLFVDVYKKQTTQKNF